MIDVHGAKTIMDLSDQKKIAVSLFSITANGCKYNQC